MVKKTVAITTARYKGLNIHPGSVHTAYWSKSSSKWYVIALDDASIANSKIDKVNYVAYLNSEDYTLPNEIDVELYKGSNINHVVNQLNKRITTIRLYCKCNP